MAETAIVEKPRTRRVSRPQRAAVRRALVGMSAAVARSNIAAYLGQQYSSERDLYTALGYKKSPVYTDFVALYRRNDVARALVNRPVRPCWRVPPTISEIGSDAEDMTAFETEVTELAQQVRLWHYMKRADKLARIGQYSVLLIGYDDISAVGQLATPVTRASDVLYVMPYGEGSATISETDSNPASRRYGKPTLYDVTLRGGVGSGNAKVHYSRVIHITEDNLENDVYGTPALENSFNRLQDLEKVVGGAGEMFWRGAYPGLAFILNEGAKILSETGMADEIEEYVHDFKRTMRLQNMTVEQLSPAVADPSGHVEVAMRMVATGSETPKRILEGSERGELSSSQDERAWVDFIDERRRQHCEPVMVRPIIDAWIQYGVVTKPTAGYAVDWADLAARSDKEMADAALVVAQALKTFTEALDAEAIMPLQLFQQRLGMTHDEIMKAAELFDAASSDVNGPDDDAEGGGNE